MNNILKQYRKNYTKAILQYKKNPTQENLKAVQAAGANYSSVKHSQNGVK